MELVSVIKYEGGNDTFVYKYPEEDFNVGTQLIVHESQEAIFFLNGQALDLFTAGKHTLTTDNLPLLNKIINIPTDGKTPFHCEVYFINKIEKLGISWGTSSKVEYIEPTYHFPISLGANGEMGIKIDNSRILLNKLVGTEDLLSSDRLISYFKSFLMIRFKTYLAKLMKEEKINVFEIDEHLERISSDVKEKLISDFENYGINLTQFFITSIIKPEGNEQYEKFKDLHFRKYSDIENAKINQQVELINQETESEKMKIESKALAEKRKTEGYSYQQERGYDVAEKVAANEGSGNFSSAGIGIGMMAGIGNAVNNSIGGTLNDSMPQVQKSFCSNCGSQISLGEKFCSTCGNPIVSNNVCPYCKQTIRENSKFCPYCGKEQQ